MSFDVYGVKPKTFVLTPEEGELMLGSEVCNYLKSFRGSLYKRYPNLWKRGATPEERKKLRDKGFEYSIHTPFLALVKASEIQKILDGNDDDFLSAIGEHHTERPHTMPAPATKPTKRGVSLLSQMPNMSFHLDAVPCATPITRAKAKRLRTYPHCYDDRNMEALHNNAKLPEVLVPIRLDLENDGLKVRDTFLWNKNEKLITPEKFAEILCDDLDLPPYQFVSHIAQAIQMQCDSFQSDIIPRDEEDR